jgi:hypothetical protein
MKKTFVFIFLALSCVCAQAQSGIGFKSHWRRATPNRVEPARLADTVRVNNLRVGTSTTAGFILTADASGNATFQNISASGGASISTARAHTGWTAQGGLIAKDTVAQRIEWGGTANASVKIFDNDGDSVIISPQNLNEFTVKDGSTILASIDSTGTGTFAGNIMLGKIFNVGDTTSVVLTAEGVAAITDCNMIIDTFGSAAADTLTNITGVNIGDLIILRSRSSNRDIFIADAAPFYIGGSFNLDDSQDIILLLVVASNNFVQLSRSNNN